jgi:hypothetical protein
MGVFVKTGLGDNFPAGHIASQSFSVPELRIYTALPNNSPVLRFFY